MKEFENSPVVASIVDHGHVNPFANNGFTIFAPLTQPHHLNLTNQQISRVVEDYKSGDIDVTDWFQSGEKEFPRTQLKYIQELGKGWFGRVVEGAAHGINSDVDWCPVVVRILEASATSRQRVLFLHDAAIYRAPLHPNILRLEGRCLDTVPLLILQEYCLQGDLKQYLKRQKISASSCDTDENLLSSELPLLWCCQLSAAIKHLHEHRIVHPDLAARNCQLTSKLELKVGDYGITESKYPEDYYHGSEVVPVRWSAPELVTFTPTTIHCKQASAESNIWSLGVSMWEIFEFGAQPYRPLNDDEVISQVLGPPHQRLPKPSCKILYTDYIYRLMQLCWSTIESRPAINQIDLMLQDLLQVYQHRNSISLQDFDNRWHTFKPNQIVKTDNSEFKSSPSLRNLAGSLDNLSLLGDKPGCLDNLLLGEKPGSLDNLFLLGDKPDQNLDSWLENVASSTGDLSFVRGLSDAMNDLDNTIASENVASSLEPSPRLKESKLQFQLGPISGSDRYFNNNSRDNSLLMNRRSSESETEDETWRVKIERGAYTEKVRQKSRSVADLMILTHIDTESDSETPLPSLDVGGVKARNSVLFGSAGNLPNVENTFQAELKRLQVERRDSLLFVPEPQQQQQNLALLESLNSPRTVEPSSLVFNVYNASVCSPMKVPLRRLDVVKIESPDVVTISTEGDLVPDIISCCSKALIREESDLSLHVVPKLTDLIENSVHLMEYIVERYDAETELNKKAKKLDFGENLDLVEAKNVNSSYLKVEGICGIEVVEAFNPNNICTVKLDLGEDSSTESNKENDLIQAINPLLIDLTKNKVSTNTLTVDSDEDQVTLIEAINPLFEISQLEISPNLKQTFRIECTNFVESLLEEAIDKYTMSRQSVIASTRNFINNELLNYEDCTLSKCPVNFDLSARNTAEENSVILGACDDYSIELYAGLKTSVNNNGERGKLATLAKSTQNLGGSDENAVKLFSLETWDKFLDNNRTNTFDSETFEPPSLLFLETTSPGIPHILITRDDNSTFTPLSPDECSDSENIAITQSESVVIESSLNRTYDVMSDCSSNDNNVAAIDCDSHCQVIMSNGVVLETVGSDGFKKEDLPGSYEVDVDDITLEMESNSALNETYDLIDTENDTVWESSNKNNSGWFLHPQQQSDQQINETELSTSSEEEEEEEEEDDSYIGFSINDDIMAAIRNELLAKLPHAQRPADCSTADSVAGAASSAAEDDFDNNEESDGNQLIMRYNIFNTPLSPIAEESFFDLLLNCTQSTPKLPINTDINDNSSSSGDSTNTEEEEEDQNDNNGSCSTTTCSEIRSRDDDSDSINMLILESFVDPEIGVNKKTDKQFFSEEEELLFTSSSCCEETPKNCVDLDEIYIDLDLNSSSNSNSRAILRLEECCNTSKSTPSSVKLINDYENISATFSSNNDYQSIGATSSGDQLELINDYSNVAPSGDTATTKLGDYENVSATSGGDTVKLDEYECVSATPSGVYVNVDGDDDDVAPEYCTISDLGYKVKSTAAAELHGYDDVMFHNHDYINSDQAANSTNTTYLNLLNTKHNNTDDVTTTSNTVDTHLYVTTTDVDDDVLLYDTPLLAGITFSGPSDAVIGDVVVGDVVVGDVIVDDVVIGDVIVDDVVIGDVVVDDVVIGDVIGDVIDDVIGDAIGDIVGDVNSYNSTAVTSIDETSIGGGGEDLQLMSTSFSARGEEGHHCNDEEQDWESGSDTRSSSSGEFIWKHTEQISPLDEIEEGEEEEEHNNDHNTVTSSGSDCDDDDDSYYKDDDTDGIVFVPSAWDKCAKPIKSALRSPERTVIATKQQEVKSRGVWFKKQKYHCIYEYPREPESPVLQSYDLWQPAPEYPMLPQDWDVDKKQPLDSTMATLSQSLLSTAATSPPFTSRNSKSIHTNNYRNSVAADFTIDEDFYLRGSSPAANQSSQFFPGSHGNAVTGRSHHDYHLPPPYHHHHHHHHHHDNNSSNNASNLKNNSETVSTVSAICCNTDNTPDSGATSGDVTPASVGSSGDEGATNNSNHVLLLTATGGGGGVTGCFSEEEEEEEDFIDSSSSKRLGKIENCSVIGGLRHTRDRLKLDLPPVNSSNNNLAGNVIFSNGGAGGKLFLGGEDITEPLVKQRQPVTFSTFGKSRFFVQHVETPPPLGTLNDGKNVSFEALPYNPLLGGTVNVVQNCSGSSSTSSSSQEDLCEDKEVTTATTGGVNRVETVRFLEASPLNSADEDSGIESCTLERKQPEKTLQNQC